MKDIDLHMIVTALDLGFAVAISEMAGVLLVEPDQAVFTGPEKPGSPIVTTMVFRLDKTPTTTELQALMDYCSKHDSDPYEHRLDDGTLIMDIVTDTRRDIPMDKNQMN